MIRLAVFLFCASLAASAQQQVILCGGYNQPACASTIPFPDIPGSIAAGQEASRKAQTDAAQTALIKQQTELLKQQTEALKQQKAALASSQASQRFIPAVRKPRIDDIDAATGKPRFATYADFEDAKDEWLIEEAMRRFEALKPSGAADPAAPK